MAIVTHGHPGGMTTQMYEEGNRRLRESGAFQTPEHLFHACYGDPNDLQILGVWETREAWDRFWNEACRPIMTEMGYDVSFSVYELTSMFAAPALLSALPGRGLRQ
jgi:hypothetical protein